MKTEREKREAIIAELDLCAKLELCADYLDSEYNNPEIEEIVCRCMRMAAAEIRRLRGDHET